MTNTYLNTQVADLAKEFNLDKGAVKELVLDAVRIARNEGLTVEEAIEESLKRKMAFLEWAKNNPSEAQELVKSVFEENGTEEVSEARLFKTVEKRVKHVLEKKKIDVPTKEELKETVRIVCTGSGLSDEDMEDVVKEMETRIVHSLARGI